MSGVTGRRRASPLAAWCRKPWAAILFLGLLVPTLSAEAGMLEKVRETGVFRIGYRVDAGPFAYRDRDGRAAGYSVELCERIAVDLGKAASLGQLSVEYVPVGTEERLEAVAEGRIDILCGVTTASLSRRETVSFSIPTFITGIAVMVDVDAARPLKALISGRSAPSEETVLEALRDKTFGVRAGTTAESWLRDNLQDIAAGANLVTVSDHRDGLQKLQNGEIDAYVADRAILVGLARSADNPDRFIIGERLFTIEPYALAIPRGDEDFRLVVDRTLSRLYRSRAFDTLLARYFGKPKETTRLLYLAVSLPE